MHSDVLMTLMNAGARISLVPEPRHDRIIIEWPEGNIEIVLSYLEKHQAMSKALLDELVGKKLMGEIIRQCRENMKRNACSTASAEPTPVAGAPPVISASDV